MATRNHPYAFTLVRLIGKLEEGSDLTSFTREFQIDKSDVARAWKTFLRADTDFKKRCWWSNNEKNVKRCQIYRHVGTNRPETDNGQYFSAAAYDRNPSILWPHIFIKLAYLPVVPSVTYY